MPAPIVYAPDPPIVYVDVERMGVLETFAIVVEGEPLTVNGDRVVATMLVLTP